MVATLTFAYMPGPALLYTAAQTLVRGRRAGLLAALGIHVGGYAHVLAAVAGIAAVLALVPTLYLVLKLAGATWLVWLGLQMIRSAPPEAERLAVQPAPTPSRSARRAFLESVVVELLNPKVAIFFLAFLPQFVDPAAALPIWLQLLVLGTIVNVTFSSADLVCVFFASKAARHLRRSDRAARAVRWIGGSILMGLGLRLALAER